jgi:L-ascorbate metabolism protein UlaG (beta-lactamase superfamily)
VYYNIIIDPWLAGPQSDVAKWFSQQWHTYESAVRSVKGIEGLIWDIEAAAGGNYDREDGSGIDAVAVCHEFTDHCHRETLEEIGTNVPVFATKVLSTRNTTVDIDPNSEIRKLLI